MSEPKRWEKPYTKWQRSELALHATLALGGNEDKVAVVCLRYEATLQAKDATIEALVKALRAYMDWEPAHQNTYDYRTQMWRAAKAAIKEATP